MFYIVAPLFQTPHTSVQQHPFSAYHSDRPYRRLELSLHEALCTEQVPAVQKAEDWMEKSGIPGQVKDPGEWMIKTDYKSLIYTTSSIA